MCGISGIYRFDRQQSEGFEALEVASQAMVDAQDTRGPDASAVWHGCGITLGHTRLAIMDPENNASNQPIHSQRWALAFNGEIYNFRALRNELKGRHNFDFTTNSDTEVLLRALDAWGVHSTLERLNGIFAFGAYDKQEHRLHLARDRLGIKPLFHYNDGDELWFASTPAAIVKASLRKWDLDYEALRSFFSLGAVCSARTLFTGVSRLCPGEVLTACTGGKIESRRYWRPAFRREPIEEALERAIVGQQEAHVRSALFLSGGVDSTIMSVYLRDIDYFHLDSPERQYAQYVADFMKRDLCVRAYTDTEHFDRYNQRYVETCGEPSASAPIPFLVSEAIQGEGYKVAFSANGADELFFGYPRTPAPELRPAHAPANDYEDPPVTEIRDQELHIFRSPQNYSIPRRQGERPELHESLAPLLHPLPEGFSSSAHRRWFELQTYVQYDLNPTLDFASMACSLEVRVPFLDHELIETALSYDANAFLSPDYGRKAPLKRILKERGMHPLLWARPKIGFSVPESVREIRQQQLESSLGELNADGYLKLSKTCLAHSRDHQYLSAAAHAFMHWKRVWIDSGIVRP
jgi:asparagine synthase (glutamine-hydrolysing)